MAESIITSVASSVISSTINSLGTLAWNEIRFLNDVPSKVQSIEAKLRVIHSYLKDAENQPLKSHLTANWLREMKGLAYRAQDVIEKIVWLQRRRNQNRSFTGVFSRYSHIPSYLRSLHEIGAEIDRINNFIPGITDTINNINVVNIKEGGSSSTSSSVINQFEDPWSKDPRTTLHVNEGDEVVGFDSETTKIVNELLDSENKQLTVVSIVGMGGIGKSTLARKVFNHVKTHFDINGSITLSKQYDILRVQKQILKATAPKIKTEDLEKMTPEQVRVKLVDSLKKRKYLIVIDDIWTTQSWKDINPNNSIFPNENNGSRIILTSRNLDVGKCPEIRTFPHELDLLNDEESWELLKKKAFPPYVMVSDQQKKQLECLGPQLVQKCKGLPLALVVLGGYLSKNLDYQIWSEMAKTVDWNERENTSEILALSYHDLPNDLKPAFLYITTFPEDKIIECSDLTRLWIAEGFVPPRQKHKLETTAEKYLDQLYQRGLVQVVQRNRIHGRISEIRIHDVLRDWGIERAKSEGFFSVIKDSDNANHSDAHILCRIVLHGYRDEDVANWINARTFLGFELPENNISLYGLNSLRVISFIRKEQGPQKLPKYIKKMIFLRYLCMRSCEINFPSSIGQLVNLQVLDCQYSVIKSLPSSLWEISTLRHVYLDAIYCNWNGPKKGQGRNLQTLVITEGNLEDLQKIVSWMYTGMDAVGIAIEDMEHIVKLQLDNEWGSITWARNILSKIYGLHYLEELELSVKRLTGIPDVSAFPPNLLKLVLTDCWDLEEDPMLVLEKLPKLVELQLIFSRKLTSMHCSASGFPQLKYFMLNYLSALRDWKVDVGAMPNLCHLWLESCSNLKTFPEELMEHNQLQLVEMVHMRHLSKVDYRRLEEKGCKVIFTGYGHIIVTDF